MRRLLAGVLLLGLLSVARPSGQDATLQLATTFAARHEFLLTVDPTAIDGVIARYGLTLLQRDVYDPGLALVAPPPDALAADVLRALQADAAVRIAEPASGTVLTETGYDLQQSTVAILDALPKEPGNVSYYGHSAWKSYVSQPVTALLRLPEAREFGTGDGIVAIIDTGVDGSHPAIAASVMPGYDFVRDVAGAASDWADLDQSTVEILDQSTVEILDTRSVQVLNGTTAVLVPSSRAAAIGSLSLPRSFGHGTMVAGLVHLVAPGARIMPLKAFRADGTARTFDIIRAINYAVANGASVINMSFSTPVATEALVNAINQGAHRGVLFTASAGNTGRQAVAFPAGLRNVFAVGSTTMADQRSAFSTYGNHIVRLGAPGEGLITSFPGGHYAAVWGTSFSTAVVSGAAALMAGGAGITFDRRIGVALETNAVGRTLLDLGAGRLNLVDALREWFY